MSRSAEGAGDWRRAFPVLVPEAQALGSIGVIRSLGRAGYPVYAAASDPSALGLSSRFAKAALIHPRHDTDQFVPWLRRTRAEYGIRAIVPSEGFLHAIRDEFDEFAPLMPISQDRRAVFEQLSKHDLFARLGASGDSGDGTHVPRLVLLEQDPGDDVFRRLESLGYPQYAKFDHAHSLAGGDNIVIEILDAQAGRRKILESLRHYRRGVVQENCAGVGVGVFLLRWNGVELARFMHLRLHEVPYTGGASSYRRAWHDESILADARRHAATLDYQGVAMFEYRWNPRSGEFRLIELNARFWGSLHLAIYSGADFPTLLLDAFFGRPTRQPAYSLSTRCRNTFPGEIDYVRSCLRSRTLGVHRKMAVVCEFFVLCIDPRVHSDYCFPGDRILYLRAMKQTLRRLFL